MRSITVVLLGTMLSLQWGCGPDCQSTCEKLYSQGGECRFTSPGDQTGEASYSVCTDACENAMEIPGKAGDYNPNEKTPSSQSVTLENDQQAAMWMDCIEEKSCELIKSTGGRFCAPIW